MARVPTAYQFLVLPNSLTRLKHDTLFFISEINKNGKQKSEFSTSIVINTFFKILKFIHVRNDNVSERSIF